MSWKHTVAVAIGLSLPALAGAGSFGAYKLPMDLNLRTCEGNCDHTYATVEGVAYSVSVSGSRSRSSGGNLVRGLSRANGRSSDRERCFANCATQGWFYGIDGLCHQQTNMADYYSGLEMLNTSVRGYSLSRQLYGAYGRYMSNLKTTCDRACP